MINPLSPWRYYDYDLTHVPKVERPVNDLRLLIYQCPVCGEPAVLRDDCFIHAASYIRLDDGASLIVALDFHDFPEGPNELL